jgi:hypothetical protein
MKRSESNDKSKPEKAYREEMEDRGNEFMDTAEESNARDQAKVEKTLRGEGGKMDSVHPDDLKQTRNDEMIEQERSND